MGRICPVCNFEEYPLQDGEIELFSRLPDIPFLQEGQDLEKREIILLDQWQVFLQQLVRFTKYFPRWICLHKDELDEHRWKLRARGKPDDIDAIASYFLQQADERQNRLCAKIAFNFCDQALGRIQARLVRPNIQDLATPYPSSPLGSDPCTE